MSREFCVLSGPDLRTVLINERTLCENFEQMSVLCFLWMRLIRLEVLCLHLLLVSAGLRSVLMWPAE